MTNNSSTIHPVDHRPCRRMWRSGQMATWIGYSGFDELQHLESWLTAPWFQMIPHLTCKVMVRLDKPTWFVHVVIATFLTHIYIYISYIYISYNMSCSVETYRLLLLCWFWTGFFQITSWRPGSGKLGAMPTDAPAPGVPAWWVQLDSMGSCWGFNWCNWCCGKWGEPPWQSNRAITVL